MTRCVLVASVVSLAVPSFAEGKKVRMDGRFELQANGDSKNVLKIIMSPDMYRQEKAKTPNARVAARAFSGNRVNALLVDEVFRWDDTENALVITNTEQGSMKNMGGGVWEDKVPEEFARDLDSAVQSTDAQGRPTFTFSASANAPDGTLVKMVIEVVAPRGARQAALDRSSLKFSYKLPFLGGGRGGKITGEIKARDKIMSGCYKVYGDPKAVEGNWVARTVLKNTGNDLVRELRVRHRIQGYSEWSPWEKVAEMVPGQTFVHAFYPIFDKSVAALRTSTPTFVEAQWSYLDSTGKPVEDGGGTRLTLMGVNEFIFGNLRPEEMAGTWNDYFNNADLLAAWVTRDDPVVRDFAALANKIAGSVQAGSSDDADRAAIRGVYELMLRNDITYQAPPGLTEKVSFDAKMVQNVKYPRDVIRSKSGTCIDLAILYAAAGHAIGLRPVVVLIPGHAFPVFRLSSGQILAVESTGVGGGSRTGSASFDEALQSGAKTLEEARKSGEMIAVDFKEAWAKGISNPELEALPSNVLQMWGYSEEGGAARPSGTGAAPRRADFSGNWVGTVVEKRDDATIRYEANVLISRGASGYTATFGGRTQMSTPKGPVDVLINGDGVSVSEIGDASSGPLLMVRVRSLVATMLATGERQVSPGNAYQLGFANGRLVGRDQSGLVRIELSRR